MLKKNKYRIELIIFIASISFNIIFNLLNYHAVYTVCKDGDLYISVAENFINNFHFIQTARPYEVNMVVPPGLSFILSILLIIGNSINFVVFIQYILFGISCVLLYKSVFNFGEFKNKTIKIIAGVFVVLLYNLSPTVLLDAASPRFVLTEIYTQAIYIVILYLLTEKKYDFKQKLEKILPVLLIGGFIRPLIFSLLFVTLITYIIILIKNKDSFKFAIKFSIVFIALFGINILVNYRETKSFVLLENYSGIPLYQANNPNTLTEPYYSSKMEKFTNDFFISVYEDKNLTIAEKSKILSKESKKWVFSNFTTFLRNTKEKFVKLFITPYNYDFHIFIIGTIILYILTKKKELFLLFTYFFLTMILTSMGLNIYRYSIFAYIIYSFIKVNLITYIIFLILKKAKRVK